MLRQRFCACAKSNRAARQTPPACARTDLRTRFRGWPPRARRSNRRRFHRAFRLPKPSITALGDPCPRPVAPSDPNNSALTRATAAVLSSVSIWRANSRAAFIGPTVCRRRRADADFEKIKDADLHGGFLAWAVLLRRKTKFYHRAAYYNRDSDGFFVDSNHAWGGFFSGCSHRLAKAAAGRFGRFRRDLDSLWLRLAVLRFYTRAAFFIFVAVPSAPSAAFYFWGLLAAVAQIVATALLLNALSRRRFAIGTLLAKTEALQIAVFGAVFFGETLRPGGWAGVALGGVGLAFVFFAREKRGAPMPTWRAILRDRSLAAGLCSGALFALTALFARRAIFAFDDDVSPFAAAALILPALVLTQAVLLGCWLWRVDRGVFAKMRALGALPLAVGATSAAGSAGWFTAFALAHPALVKTLAQIELPLALLWGRLVFGEKCARRRDCRHRRHGGRDFARRLVLIFSRPRPPVGFLRRRV